MPCDHAPLSVIRGLLLCTSISLCKSCPLSGVKRCPLFGGSLYTSYIGRLAGAKARLPEIMEPGLEWVECVAA